MIINPTMQMGGISYIGNNTGTVVGGDYHTLVHAGEINPTMHLRSAGVLELLREGGGNIKLPLCVV